MRQLKHTHSLGAVLATDSFMFVVTGFERPGVYWAQAVQGGCRFTVRAADVVTPDSIPMRELDRRVLRGIQEVVSSIVSRPVRQASANC